ncbi:MAG: Holliday junction DNA helicase RuvA [Patiriisocius sp.]
MITFIEGKLVEKSPTHAVISCNGVGYLLNISMNTFSKVKDEEMCKLLTHYAVSVDVRSGASSHNLYGFADETERFLFRTLIKISGVSSNMANIILSTMSPNDLQNAVANKDLDKIKSVKGVGPKLAQRILMELSGKLDLPDLVGNIYPPAGNTIRNEALSALCSLGFDKSKVDTVLKQVIEKTTQDSTVEELIKESLKVL